MWDRFPIRHGVHYERGVKHSQSFPGCIFPLGFGSLCDPNRLSIQSFPNSKQMSPARSFRCPFA